MTRLLCASRASRLGLAGLLGLVVGTASACLRPCRTIETAPLALQCESGLFTGELHFDDAPTFATFLESNCIPSATFDDVSAVVDAVDFTTQAAFVAGGPRLQSESRCIDRRRVDEVGVCEDGLRVAFDDDVSDGSADGCEGSWTLAFTLPRAELRAALTDDGF